MEVLKAPTRWGNEHLNKKKVFLAGSIEMGKAEDWQETVTQALSDLDIVILNPRRDDWDVSAEQSIDNEYFREQVEWELDAQDQCDLIVMYFDPNTKSPITLLELGMFLQTGRLLVCCPQGYWRRGNVEIVCERDKVPMFWEMEEFILAIRRELDSE